MKKSVNKEGCIGIRVHRNSAESSLFYRVNETEGYGILGEKADLETRSPIYLSKISRIFNGNI